MSNNVDFFADISLAQNSWDFFIRSGFDSVVNVFTKDPENNLSGLENFREKIVERFRGDLSIDDISHFDVSGDATALCEFICTAIEAFKFTTPVGRDIEERIVKCHARLGLPIHKSYLFGQNLVWGFKHVLSFQHDETLWSLRADNWYVNGTHHRKLQIVKAYMKSWSVVFKHMTNLLHFILCRECDQPNVSPPSSPLSIGSIGSCESLLTTELVSVHTGSHSPPFRKRRESSCSSISSLGSESSAGTQIKSDFPPPPAPTIASSFTSPCTLNAYVVASREPHVPCSPKSKTRRPLYTDSSLTANLLPCIHSTCEGMTSPYVNNNVLLPKLSSPLDDVSSMSSNIGALLGADNSISSMVSDMSKTSNQSDDEVEMLAAPSLRAMSIKPIDISECTTSKPISHSLWLVQKRTSEKKKRSQRKILTKIDQEVQFPIQAKLDKKHYPSISQQCKTEDKPVPQSAENSNAQKLPLSPPLSLPLSPPILPNIKFATGNVPFRGPVRKSYSSSSATMNDETTARSDLSAPYSAQRKALLNEHISSPTTPLASLPQVSTPMFPSELAVPTTPPHLAQRYVPAMGVPRMTPMTPVRTTIRGSSKKRSLAPIGFLDKGNGAVSIQYSSNRKKLNSCC